MAPLETREVRVLLVEDSLEERRLVSLELAEIDEPDFRCTEAGRLSEAEAELRKARTDVVLLDLSLPDSSGLSGLVRLCREFPSLPVVVHTGLDDQEVALQALREGGQDFLVKGQSNPADLRRVLLHAIERKRVDVALASSHESLCEAQRLETLGRLAGKVAHDFNNILTSVVGYSELLLEDLEGHPCVEDLLEIKKAGKRGIALTRNILSYARKEASSLGAFSLNEAVLGISGMLKQLLPQSITLKQELLPDEPSALGNLGQVEQALVNLVVNARDAMPAGGTIVIKTHLHVLEQASSKFGDAPDPGTYIAVTVEDDGAGMSEATLDRIFEPFYTTKPRGAGTGLGLSTVAGIGRRAGGGVEVESALGVGSRFTLSFPIADEASLDSATGVSELGEVASSPAGLDISSLLKGRGKTLAFQNDKDKLSWSQERDESREHLHHLYYVVSHDFHEPVRMVSSYLGLLKRRAGESLSEDSLEFLNYAFEASERLQGMLKALLRYSRALQATPKAEPVLAHDLFLSILAGLPGREAIRWCGEHPVLEGSAEHFSSILSELLSNAMKFANPVQPEIRVEYRREPLAGVFEVHDNGLGFPSDTPEKSFRLFGRLHSRDESPGLGVGLALAQVLAEKYGARLSLGCDCSGGCVVLRWPADKVCVEVER